MNAEELHRLIEEYRDGSITLTRARQLADAIRAERATAEAAHRELALSGHLGQALEGAGDEAFVRSFFERLAAERGGAEFLRAFEKRSSVRPVRTRRIETPRPSIVPFLAAAGLLVATLGLLMFSARRPVAAPGVARHEVPAPPREEPDPVPDTTPEPPPSPPVRPPEAPRTSAPPAVTPAPPPAPEPPPAPTPAKPAEAIRPVPAGSTEVAPSSAVARIDRFEGEVFLTADGERHAAKAGSEVPPGAGVATGMYRSRASLVLADGTRFSIGSDSAIRDLSKGPRGTRVALLIGTIMADVARQPVDQPLVFVTPHGEARVLGTVLRLTVDSAWTRLEVKEGKVRFTREGKSVDVIAGQYAAAGAGMPLLARSLSPDEIVLYPQLARLTGAEWSLQRDLKSLAGVVLEAGPTPFKVVDHVETRPAYATFTFFAPADKEYRLWIRASSFEKGDPWTRDAVTIEPTRAVLSQKSPFFGSAPTTAWVVTGVAATPGYSWISGHGEEGKVEPPLVVKFNETGFQNLRVFVGHPWVRVDEIWLSATQKTRPSARQSPPPAEK